MNERRNVPEIVIVILRIASPDPKLGSISSLRCQKSRTRTPKGCDMRSDVSRTIYSRPLRRSSIPSGGARRDRTDDLMLAKHALSQLSYGPVPEDECLTLDERRMRSIKVVGLGRLELPTSRLSSARSNQLSYKPLTRGTCSRASGSRHMHRTSAAPGACSSAKKEKRRRRNPANGAQRSGDRWPLMFQKRFDKSKLLKNHP
jgi:hypothetical protein